MSKFLKIKFYKGNNDQHRLNYQTSLDRRLSSFDKKLRFKGRVHILFIYIKWMFINLLI